MKQEMIRKKQFKQMTSDDFSDSAIGNTATLFADKQKQIQTAMFKHFKDVRNLCTPQQQPKFDLLFYTMMNKRNDERKK